MTKVLPEDLRVSARGRVKLISVITVTYNSGALVTGALRSAQAAAAASGLNVELLVIDNASDDLTAQVVAGDFPDAVVVANPENVGFARANNQAFSLARGDLWLLLNPDASLAPDALPPLIRLFEERPRAGAVAPSIHTGYGGGPESAGMSPGIRSAIGHFLLVNRLLWRDRGGCWRGVTLRRRPGLGPRSVDWLSAAALLLRPEAVRSVDGFDQRFFLYREDIDLGERLRRAGWELWTVPGATATHLIAGSQGRVSTRWIGAAHDHYRSGAGPVGTLAYDLVVAAGLSFRAVVSTGIDHSPEGRIHAETMRAGAVAAWRVTARTLRDLLTSG